MRILIATGGEPYSDVAVRMGAYVVATTGAAPTLLAVRPPRTAHSESLRVLSRATGLLEATPNLKTGVCAGNPAEEIVREAEAGDYDLVILGERPRPHVVRRILGSTVERVIARSPCPVMIARKATPLHRVLVCEGGSRLPLLQRLILRLAPLLDGASHIMVLHVMSHIAAGPGVSGWELQAGAEDHIHHRTPEGELLLKDVKTLAGAGLRSKVKIRHGLVVDEIVREARDGDYDLVVIGAHRVDGWQRLLLDDLSHQIIANTTQSLLVVV